MTTQHEELTERLRSWAATQACGCGYAGGLWFEWRLQAKPIGSFSLAGAQMKVSANREPWIVCPPCGAEAQGK